MKIGFRLSAGRPERELRIQGEQVAAEMTSSSPTHDHQESRKVDRRELAEQLLKTKSSSARVPIVCVNTDEGERALTNCAHRQREQPREQDLQEIRRWQGRKRLEPFLFKREGLKFREKDNCVQYWAYGACR